MEWAPRIAADTGVRGRDVDELVAELAEEEEDPEDEEVAEPEPLRCLF